AGQRVHLIEQLVQAAAAAAAEHAAHRAHAHAAHAAAAAPDRVDLVEEEDAGAVLAGQLVGLVEEAPDAHDVHAHEHALDRGGREVAERDAGLGRDALGEVALAGARRADQQ